MSLITVFQGDYLKFPKIEDNVKIPDKKRCGGRKKGSGKSKAYLLGNKIYSDLEVGKSIFINLRDVEDRKGVQIRLLRLNKDNNTEFEYITRYEEKTEDGRFYIGFRIFRTK